MPTSVKMDACYTGLIGAIILPEVRTISGAALAPLIISFGYNIFFSFLFFSFLRFQMPPDLFWIKINIFEAAKRGCLVSITV